MVKARKTKSNAVHLHCFYHVHSPHTANDNKHTNNLFRPYKPCSALSSEEEIKTWFLCLNICHFFLTTTCNCLTTWTYMKTWKHLSGDYLSSRGTLCIYFNLKKPAQLSYHAIRVCRFSVLLWLRRIAAGRKQSSQEGTKYTGWLLCNFILRRASERITKNPLFDIYFGTWLTSFGHLELLKTLLCQLLSLCFSQSRTSLLYSGFLNLFVAWNKRFKKIRHIPSLWYDWKVSALKEKTKVIQPLENNVNWWTSADFPPKTKHFWKMLSLT